MIRNYLQENFVYMVVFYNCARLGGIGRQTLLQALSTHTSLYFRLCFMQDPLCL